MREDTLKLGQFDELKAKICKISQDQRHPNVMDNMTFELSLKKWVEFHIIYTSQYVEGT